MKIIPGFPTGGAPSGTVGAMVASHNRYGYYFRTYVIPTNPNSIRQQATRAEFAALVNLWTNTLTPAQRTAWDNYGANVAVTDRIGQTIFLTGQNHYIRSNLPRPAASLARVDAAPIIFDLGAPVTRIGITTLGTLDTIGINFAEDAMSMTAFVSGGASDDGDVLFYLGRPVNDTINFFKGPYQLAEVSAIAAAATSAAFTSLFTALLSDNGDPADLQRRGVHFRVTYDDGRLTEPYQILAPVAPEAV